MLMLVILRAHSDRFVPGKCNIKLYAEMQYIQKM